MNNQFDEVARGLAEPATPRPMTTGSYACSIFASFFMLCFAGGSAPAQQFSPWSAPVNLGSSLNTEFSEFHSAISADRLSLFFASDRPGGFGELDLWVAQRSDRDADWGPAQNLGPSFNTPNGEFGLELSPDGHWLFFSSDGLAGGNTSRIYAAFRHDTSDNFGWGEPVDLGKGVNSRHDTGDPTLFMDPQTGVITLYFARLDRPNRDDWNIYASSFRADGTFSRAVLVPELSSPYRDAHPTVRRDGLEMVLASNRPGSLGGIDLWVSARRTTHDKWSTPVNLGPTVNTSSEERAPYLSDDGQTLLFTSDRLGGFGDNDFYMITRKKTQ